jgi:DNA primase
MCQIELKISDIARKYGVKFMGKRAICPFHKLDIKKDINSLTFDDDLNTFYCSECGASGDLNDFVKEIREVQNENNR